MGPHVKVSEKSPASIDPACAFESRHPPFIVGGTKLEGDKLIAVASS